MTSRKKMRLSLVKRREGVRRDGGAGMFEYRELEQGWEVQSGSVQLQIHLLYVLLASLKSDLEKEAQS